MCPFRPTVLDVAKYFDDRMTIGYSDHAIRFKRLARLRLGRRAPAVESKAASRKPRQLKVYKNPHSGEVVETNGGNHKTLKKWKTKHGAATVESG